MRPATGLRSAMRRRRTVVSTSRARRVAVQYLIVGALVIFAVPPAGAQHRGPSQIVGIVTDANGMPLADAQVTVSGLKRVASTDAQGRYRIDGLQTDSVLVLYRRSGSRLASVNIQLVPGENQANVELEDMPQRLDAAITSVEQTGVFGVIGDTAFNVLVGAEVSVAGKTGSTMTDSTGAFFVDPVRPGANLLEVRARGFKPRILSFNMPKKGGTKLAVWMTPVKFGLTLNQVRRESDFDNMLKSDLADFDRRQRWKTTRAGVTSREEMSRLTPHMRLSDAVEFLPELAKKGIRVKDGSGRGFVSCAIVDGIARADPSGNVLEWYDTVEVESLELNPMSPGPSDWSSSLLPCTGQQNRLGRGFTNPVRTGVAGSGGNGGGNAVIAVIILRR